MAESEVARLLQEIELTYQGVKSGMYDFAEGTARHDFINTKMERLEEQRIALTRMVGSHQAMQLMTRVLENI
jgi:hypothetical protein